MIKAQMRSIKELGFEVIHLLLHLSADEVLGMGSDFVCLIAENKQRNLLLHNTSLGQNIIQIPTKNKVSVRIHTGTEMLSS